MRQWVRGGLDEAPLVERYREKQKVTKTDTDT